jgi:hypothetical protein
MHQAWWRLAACDGLVQRGQRQARRQRLVQRPAYHFAGESIEEHGQIDELRAQTNVRDIGHRELIDPGQRQATGEIQVHLQVMLRIDCDHKGPWLDGEQVIVLHEPCHSLVIDQQAAPPQFRRDSPIASLPPMRQRDLLDFVSHGHLFVQGMRLLQ